MNILITGGSTGLGKALVERCAADASHNIIFTYCRHEADAQALADSYKNVKAVQVDFCDEASVNQFVENLEAESIDVLINNAYAGNPQGTHFFKTDPEAFSESFRCNVMPLIKISQACIAGMRKRKFGKIINIITSYVMDVPPTGFSVYTATKAYIRQLSKSMSKELGRFNITSNCILPDYMQTDFGQVEDFQLEQMKNAHPLKELLKPQEVAEVVCQLLNTTQQLNGVEIPINAAQHMF
ncbi:3-oxoacyl-[acyl-carrier protein] reductase [Prevotella sp. khp7]|uniref:SDR family NAD(P)-dependent oxidoreductase n=1 Tax=Prevotella sp. khp7 TaxID=1761885 RepID=UPI0008ADB7D7|nr:SDR family oxidoreductase [Prevotella sp. khp7]SEV81400.1 3-oxoacyl-[acyl-carrier protein] reductase [Prevotella sp. khp7]